MIAIGDATCATQPLGHPACLGDADPTDRYLVAVIRSRDGASPLRITSQLGYRFRIGVERLAERDPHRSMVIVTDSEDTDGCFSTAIAHAEPRGFAEGRLKTVDDGRRTPLVCGQSLARPAFRRPASTAPAPPCLATLRHERSSSITG